ncbi:GTPase HflX [Halovivax sp.]|uniref:GTPase HflX n=1 Tax=Halovivax sp. TaxID=1935978 RepID=UPI0025C6AB67|nr:GTPase HflX [Halovivax sp.]
MRGERHRQTERNRPKAVVAAVAGETPVDTEEIRALTRAAGYAVVGECTQTRPPDPGTLLGSGKVEELAELVDATGASLVVVDDELTPGQTTTVRERLPDGVRVFDRYRLVLDIFGEQARTRRAQLQVELARLQYELPRIRAEADEGVLNRRTEKGSPWYDVRDRIDRLERTLDELASPAEQFRERRRAQDFDLVTIAGYTNAGKSTLLHRLADDLSATGTASDHPDEDAVASIEDRLFETLETTTRRATLRGRPALVTDTVGFVQDLPHELVRSFSETLSEAAAADAVVLVADASDPLEEFREKLEVSLDVLDAQGVDRHDVVTAINKADLSSEAALADRLAIAREAAPAPVSTSASEGTNVDRLVSAVTERLPTEHARLTVPNCGESMALVSRLYDEAAVESVDYDGDEVRVVVSGRPRVLAKARADAEALGADGSSRSGSS